MVGSARLLLRRTVACLALWLPGCYLVGYGTLELGDDAGLDAGPRGDAANDASASEAGDARDLDALAAQDGNLRADAVVDGASLDGAAVDAASDGATGEAAISDAAVQTVCQPAQDCDPVCALGACAIDCNQADKCRSSCSGASACGIDCNDINECALECGGTSVCALDCTDANNCTTRCRDRASCRVNCTDANNCAVRCEASSRCDIDCTDGINCDQVECHAGAVCVLRCNGAVNCAMKCDGTGLSCPSGVRTCNAPCP